MIFQEIMNRPLTDINILLFIRKLDFTNLIIFGLEVLITSFHCIAFLYFAFLSCFIFRSISPIGDQRHKCHNNPKLFNKHYKQYMTVFCDKQKTQQCRTKRGMF